MTEDRRHFQRIGLDSPLPVVLDQSNRGLVIDVSEAGLAVCEFETRTPGDVVPFLFDLPEGNGRVEGKAEIVWKNDSVHRTGLRFLEMAQPGRDQLVEWISSRAWTMRTAGVEREYPEPADVAVAQPATIRSDSAQGQDAETTGAVALPPMPQLAGADFSPGGTAQATFGAVAERVKPGRTIVISVLAILLLSASVFLLRSSRGAGVRQQAADYAPTETATAESTPAESVPTPSSPAPASAAAAAPDVSPPSPTKPSTPVARPNAPGVVLQVGAMRQEANATALLNELQRKNLPAFILPPHSDGFYRVVVGPYPGGESSLKVMDQLQKYGMKSIVRPWAPK